VFVTVTEALVLRPLPEDRGRITVNPYQNETVLLAENIQQLKTSLITRPTDPSYVLLGKK